MIRGKHLVYALMFFFSSMSHASPSQSAHDWLTQNTGFAYEKISINTSPADGAKGAVVASTSRVNPNYYYHWVRDAAIAMDSMISFYQHYADKRERQSIRQKLFDYLDFSTRLQNTPTLSDLGEPKFNIDGSAFNEAWGRPQIDSPALRAISLIHWANILIADGQLNVVKEKMYNGQYPATSPIKKDLEYVSHHWKDPTFDVWEEVKGTHFYTLMVSRRAMIEGATLARQLNDQGAANWYLQQAKEMELELQNFWDPARGYFVATIKREGGLDYKHSNLDTAVILGLLHGDMQDGFFAWDDPRIVGTLFKLIQAFSTLYPINQQANIPGYGIGRYPEDQYSGSQMKGGNPWVVCTLSVAEALYRYAHTLEKQGHSDSAKEVSDMAEQFVKRVKFHANPDGTLSEQMNRYSGYMISAENLTWNYAALISTRIDAEEI